MIITLIGIVVLALGIIGFIIYTNTYFGQEWLDYLSIPLLFLGVIYTCIVFVLISIVHIGTDKQIHTNQMTHDAIVAQVESINSDYEDVSKTEVIQRVYEWNSEVYSAKYWSENPWTSWFWNKRVVDSLEYIELDLKEPDAK